jgi:hypothetical protein
MLFFSMFNGRGKVEISLSSNSHGCSTSTQVTTAFPG